MASAGDSARTASCHVYRQTESWRWVLGGSRQEFNVFTTHRVGLHVERILNDVSTLGLSGNLEYRNRADERAFGGLMITVYPLDALALRSGFGFERQEREFAEPLREWHRSGAPILPR